MALGAPLLVGGVIAEGVLAALAAWHGEPWAVAEWGAWVCAAEAGWTVLAGLRRRQRGRPRQAAGPSCWTAGELTALETGAGLRDAVWATEAREEAV